MICPDAVTRRGLVALLLAASLCGCATAHTDTSQLEAAIERFERAAAQAEVAAAQAQASARQAEAAAQAVAAESPSGASSAPPGSDGYRRCAAGGGGPVRTATQAAGIAQAFLRCLELSWGEPVEIVRFAADRYRVGYDADPAGAPRSVLLHSCSFVPPTNLPSSYFM